MYKNVGTFLFTFRMKKIRQQNVCVIRFLFIFISIQNKQNIQQGRIYKVLLPDVYLQNVHDYCSANQK